MNRVIRILLATILSSGSAFAGSNPPKETPQSVQYICGHVVQVTRIENFGTGFIQPVVKVYDEARRKEVYLALSTPHTAAFNKRLEDLAKTKLRRCFKASSYEDDTIYDRPTLRKIVDPRNISKK